MNAPVQPNRHITREAWLGAAMTLMAQRLFAPAGYAFPQNVRVSCSFPHRGGLAPKRRVLGQAWHYEASADEHFEIFVSPNVDDPAEVLRILCHEMGHLTVGIECGHRGAFRKWALEMGLKPPMTSTPAGAAFKRSIAPILDELGPYPHARLGPALGEDSEPQSTGKKRQKGRMHKGLCADCGLVLRLTKSWIEGRTLTCPDMHCGGHEEPLLIS